jgi:type VI secretion system Hcp family effector
MFATVMTIKGLDGESIVKGYENSIDLTWIKHEFQMPMTKDKSSNAGPTGRPTLGDFQIGTLLNKAYPLFLKSCAAGKNLGDVTITSMRIVDGKLKPIVTFTLEHTYIAEVLMSGVEGADSANDASHAQVSVRLNYDAITTKYDITDNAAKANGAVDSGKLTANGAPA